VERENRGQSHRNELTIENESNRAGYGRPHNELVREFKSYIKYTVHQKTRDYRTPSEIISNKLDRQAQSADPDEREFFSALRYAWDVLAYDHYPLGSCACGSAINNFLNQPV
jgi:hypothetical protein